MVESHEKCLYVSLCSPTNEYIRDRYQCVKSSTFFRLFQTTPMEKINQFVYILGFMLLMVTFFTGAAINHSGSNNRSKHLKQKLVGTDCIQSTVHNQACHGSHCHTSTSYLNGCDTYDSSADCDNLTVTYDVRNSTAWRNTTCDLYACGDILNDECADGNYTYRSCTNGDCFSGVTRLHGCFSNQEYVFDQLTGPSVLSFLGVSDNLKDFFDIPCINLLFYNLRQHQLAREKPDQ